MVFIKKHYKKFLIFCSLFILAYSFLFVNSTQVNAQGLTTNSSYFSSSSSYIDYPISPGYPSVRVDIPFSYNGNFDYELSSSIMGESLSLGFSLYENTLLNSNSLIYSRSGFFKTFVEWYRGPLSFYCSSLLYDPLALDSSTNHSPFFVVVDTVSTDTVLCEYSFSYLLYNEDSKTLLSNTYSNTIAVQDSSSGYPKFFIIEDFVNSLSVNYDYYYFYDINLSLSSDFSNLSTVYFCYPLGSDIINNYQSFIDLNGFDLGLTDSELDSIYNDGYAAGVESVNTQDYYNQGYTHASEDFLKFENLVFGVMNGFTNTISQLLDFEIFGISIFGLIGGLVAVAFGVGITIIVIKIIKMFT